MTPMPRILTVSRRLYGMLLRVYPAAFRCAYEAEMAQLFADSCRDVYAQRGVRGVLGIWRRMLGDLAVNAGKERAVQMTNHLRVGRKSMVAAVVALVCSTALGYENLHNDEVQLALLGLLLATFLLGFVQPKRAWRWAIVVSMGIPISGLLALKIGNAFPCRPGHLYSCTPPTFGDAVSSVFVLIPALLSVYAGAWLRRLMTESRTEV